jgi:hypothetical protein
MKTALLASLTLFLTFQSRPLFAGTFIDHTGQYKIEKTSWTIEHLPGKGISFSRVVPFGSSGITPDWIPKDGWFVYVQDDDHVWIFDGGKRVELLEVTPKMTTLYANRTLPYSPPAIVLERLPLEIRNGLKQK